MFFALATALSLISGVTLGLRYRALALLPISWAAILIVIVGGEMLGLGFWKCVLVSVAYLTMLQASYLFGANFSNLPIDAGDEDANPRTPVGRILGEV